MIVTLPNIGQHDALRKQLEFVWLERLEEAVAAGLEPASDVGVRVCLFRARHALAELSGLDRAFADAGEGPLVPRPAAGPGIVGSLAGGAS